MVPTLTELTACKQILNLVHLDRLPERPGVQQRAQKRRRLEGWGVGMGCAGSSESTPWVWVD